MDPYAVAPSLHESIPLWRRALWPGLLSAAAVGGLVALHSWQQSFEDRVWAEAKFDPAEVVAAHEAIASIEAFAPTTRERDAGVVLNRHLQLYGNEGPAPEPVWWTHVDKADAKRIKAHWLDDPTQAFGTDPWTRYDDTILASLQAYDHWNVDSSGAYRAYLNGPQTELGEAPFPDYAGLPYLGKARLARGLAEGQVRPALEEVRQLARLLVHGEDLLPVMVGLVLLESEREAAERAVERGLLEPGEWVAVSEADIKLARGALFTGGAMLSLPGCSEARAFFEREQLFGRCAMLQDAGIAFAATRPTTEVDPAPLEADFPGLRTQYDALLETSDCRLVDLRRRLTAPLPETRNGRVAVSRLPYLRSEESMEVFELMVQRKLP